MTANQSQSSPNPARDKVTVGTVCLRLALGVFLVFGRVAGAWFVSNDTSTGKPPIGCE